MDEFIERWRALIIGFLLLVIAAGLVVLFVRWPRPETAEKSGVLPVWPVQPTLQAIRTVERQLRVHVTGAVRQPGAYSFRDGERIEDAIKAAGGATAEADLSRLNLAQRLRDEGYIVVPEKGSTPLPAMGSSSGGPTPAPGGKLNINKASLAQLDTLPGIGATYAQRIVDYREKNGPFQKTTDLVTMKIIPQSTFDKIKDLIDVL